MTRLAPRASGACRAERAAATDKALRFHWSLSQVGTPLRRATTMESMSGHLSFAPQLELCRCAEENGIDSLLMAIGFTRPDPILLSAALGQQTERVKFMVACRPGLVSPTAFVQQINTLSLLVDGRVHIDMVGGHTPHEFQSYGDWLPREERHARLDEFLSVCHAFWAADGEEIDFTGRYYRIEKGRLPTPFGLNGQRRPEIFLGGNSVESMELAIRHADCLWRLAEPPESLAPAIAPAIRSGKEVGMLVSLISRRTRLEAVEAASALVERVGQPAREVEAAFEQQTEMAAFRSTFALMRQYAGNWATPTLWTGAVPVLGAPAITLVGSAEEVADSLLEYKAIGVTQFLFMGWPDTEEMAFFGREILPLVREGEAAGSPQPMLET